MKVMSTRMFVILIGYCCIGSHWGRVPTQVVRAGRPGSEGGVGRGGAGPGPTKRRCDAARDVIQGWKKPQPLRPMHWVFYFNANKKTWFLQMLLFQHLVVGNRHHHWRTLGPLPYTLNFSAIKPNKTIFCLTSNDWFILYKKTMKNPIVKKNTWCQPWH